ncbi:substrate-binding domain-containing protein [Paenibacillus mendelii]|uniref:Substrate-binding domain-containing protein n=1 Tax=Paenibacillus mendelii TaxID=206163 RepID=A0ABV6JEL3_9BACL
MQNHHCSLNIPGDIAIVGMDNLDIASRVHPKLTSVSLVQVEIGRNAALILMNRLHGTAVADNAVKLLPRLVVRESSIRFG